jgi:hypothetical protein
VALQVLQAVAFECSLREGLRRTCGFQPTELDSSTPVGWMNLRQGVACTCYHGVAELG